MVAASRALDRSRPIWRAVATSVVPEASQLDAAEWAAFEAIVARALAARPARTRRQVALFLTLLDWPPLLRYGRRLSTPDTPPPQTPAAAGQRQPLEKQEEQRHQPPEIVRAHP